MSSYQQDDYSRMSQQATQKRSVGLLHGAGYVGGELLRLLLNHPNLDLADVTSRTFAGDPLSAAHPHLRGQSGHSFSEMISDINRLDALIVAAEHGRSCKVVPELLDEGFDGVIVDLSADFRHANAEVYPEWYGWEHPAPELLHDFQYGIPEVYAPYDPSTQFVANPGCFATAISLALFPLARHLPELRANVTALTGASGSGASPSTGTHFPTRDGNLRAYKVLGHQHLPEIEMICGESATISFTPVSGPFTRGIWGTAHIQLPEDISGSEVEAYFDEAYADAPLVRTWPGEIPELRYAVNTPFCDIGWINKGHELVVGFAIDNLLKGAASQAIQNLNLLLDLPETAGLIPAEHSSHEPASIPA